MSCFTSTSNEIHGPLKAVLRKGRVEGGERKKLEYITEIEFSLERSGQESYVAFFHGDILQPAIRCFKLLTSFETAQRTDSRFAR